MKKLSVALAVFNEERYLKKCLDSVQDIADEMIIVDGGSKDKTVEIARKYKANIIPTNNPPIFHINKQKALDASVGEWILQLDADEIITPELKKEIVSVISQPFVKEQGYFIPRRNIFWGHKMKKTGVYPDYAIRLIKNGKGKFPCKSVHEFIEVDGEIGYLKEPMIHYSYETFGDYWRKANAYTSLTASEFKKTHLKISFFTILLYNFFRPTQTFITLFIRNLGFVDGIYGFFFSFFSALHEPISFWKYATKKV